MYIKLQDGDSIFIWDDKNRQMYESRLGEDVFIERPITLEVLEKFRPYLKEISRHTKRPKELLKNKEGD